MNSFEEIIERLKDLLSTRHNKRRVFDKDVALYLGIPYKKLSRYKRSNKIPYYEISEFCYREKISMDWLLYTDYMIFIKRQVQRVE